MLCFSDRGSLQDVIDYIDAVLKDDEVTSATGCEFDQIKPEGGQQIDFPTQTARFAFQVIMGLHRQVRRVLLGNKVTGAIAWLNGKLQDVCIGSRMVPLVIIDRQEKNKSDKKWFV